MKTVMIVDDDRNLRRLYKAELETEGYKIMLAENGRQALQLLRTHTPDLVIMDIRMPEIDGLETMAHVLKDYERIPVILNTAYSSYQDNFLAWAAESYVIKSSDLGPLKNKICEVLEHRCAVASS